MSLSLVFVVGLAGTGEPVSSAWPARRAPPSSQDNRSAWWELRDFLRRDAGSWAMTSKQLRVAAAVVALAYTAIQVFQEYVFRAVGEPSTPAEGLALSGH